MSQNEHLQGESMCWNKYCMSCYMMTKHRPLLVRHIDSISCWYNWYKNIHTWPSNA